MRDWDQITRAFVDDGLVAEEHRAALAERLRGLPAEPAAALPYGPIVTLLVAGAIWLLTGACATVLVVLGADDRTTIGALVSACGVTAFGLGGLLRLAPRLLPLARGGLAAAPPVLTTGAMLLLGGDPVMGAAMVPGVVGAAVALAEGGRSTAATSALSAAVAALVWISELRRGWDESAALAALGVAVVLVGVLAVASRRVPSRAQVLGVTIPAVLLFVLVDVFLTGTHLGPFWKGIRYQGWMLEKFLELLAAGGLAVLAGALGRSAWTLVPALGLVAVATVGVASTLGSWIGGTIALTLVGAAFLGLAVVMFAVRQAAERRAEASDGTG